MKPVLPFLFVLMTACTAFRAFAQDPLSLRLQNYMDDRHRVTNFSGTALVARGGSVFLHKAYGMASDAVPNDSNTRFSLASVSKQFTAVAILQLVQNRQLSLHSPLEEFLPGFPSGERITIHHLLSHSSGLHMDFDSLYVDHSPLTHDSALAFLQKQTLLFEPGTDVAYSNTGYYLLARILEKVSGKTWATYLHDSIFLPAGMYHSFAGDGSPLPLHTASGSYPQNGTYIPNPFINRALNTGHDGVYSTSGDLLRWQNALFQDSLLLSPALRDSMIQVQSPPFWGYGLLIDPPFNQGHRLYMHDGLFYGACTSFHYYPDDDLTVIVLSNNQSPSHLYACALAGIVFGKTPDPGGPHVPITLAPRIQKRYAGVYGKHRILYRKGKLYHNTFERELIPEAADRFFRADQPEIVVEFLRDEKGKIEGVRILKAGLGEEFRKAIS